MMKVIIANQIDTKKLNNIPGQSQVLVIGQGAQNHSATLEVWNRKGGGKPDELISRKGSIGCAQYLKIAMWNNMKDRYFLYFIKKSEFINPYKDTISDFEYLNFWLSFIKGLGFKVELDEVDRDYEYYGVPCYEEHISNTKAKEKHKCYVFKVEYSSGLVDNNAYNVHKFFVNWQVIRYINSNFGYLIVQNCYRLKQQFGDKLDDFTIFQLAHLYNPQQLYNPTWQIYPSMKYDYINKVNLNKFELDNIVYMPTSNTDGFSNPSADILVKFISSKEDFWERLERASSINGTFLYDNCLNKNPLKIPDYEKLAYFKSYIGGDRVVLNPSRVEIFEKLVTCIGESNELKVIEEVLDLVLPHRVKTKSLKINKNKLTTIDE